MQAKAPNAPPFRAIGHIQYAPATGSLVPQKAIDRGAEAGSGSINANCPKNDLSHRLDHQRRPDRAGAVELIKNGDVMSVIGQKAGRGQTTNPRPNNSDVQPFIHKTALAGAGVFRKSLGCDFCDQLFRDLDGVQRGPL